MVEVRQLTSASEHALHDLNELLSHLRREPTPGSLEDLSRIVSDGNTVAVIAESDTGIIGLGMLFIIQKLGRKLGFIEDVIVDASYRGQGLGTKILGRLIEAAREKGLRTIDLTSNPERGAANTLYGKLGFEKRETNVYRLKL
ncbi:MAG: hypothetical protein RLZZ416_749 [Candidatus Parcubacteria bacterium]|jgi:ribosomal protein S18 acetylase RimI-like enzyme